MNQPGKPMREVLGELLDELPPETVVYRTMNNETFTASKMADEIRNGTEDGLSYGSDLLRISRNLLARSAGY